MFIMIVQPQHTFEVTVVINAGMHFAGLLYLTHPSTVNTHSRGENFTDSLGYHKQKPIFLYL